MAACPFGNTNLPDGASPPTPEAAIALLRTLAEFLHKDTPAPTSVNTTWAGGAAVEWHLPGIDLEITCEPDQLAAFSYDDAGGQELDGTVASDITARVSHYGRIAGGS